MSAWSCSLPWMTPPKYDPIPLFDEESNRPAATGSSGLSRTRSRLLNRIIRVVNVLLALALLAYLYWRSSPDLSLMLDTSILDLTEPGIDSGMAYKPYMAGLTNIDWSQYAYIQYVTDKNYLCNSLMIFQSLQRLGSRAERLMMYPEQWFLDLEASNSTLLRQARDDHGVKLVPIRVQQFTGEATWSESFTKLLAFNQTQYERVISLDSDANVLKHMDELFFLPQTTVAMPGAYWLDNTLSSLLMVIQPSKVEFERIQHALKHRSTTDFDMEIMNDLYGRDCLVLPHRHYALLTREFRSQEHHKYLGSTTEVWDSRSILQEASFLHFTDWPYPKPWIAASEAMRMEIQPACRNTTSGEVDCGDREIWNHFYQEYRDRRERVCGLDAF